MSSSNNFDCLTEIENNIMLDEIQKKKDKVDIIKTITNNDKSSKPQDIKYSDAYAFFTILGQNPDELCPHGLKFFQCMPCSH